MAAGSVGAKSIGADFGRRFAGCAGNRQSLYIASMSYLSPLARRFKALPAVVQSALWMTLSAFAYAATAAVVHHVGQRLPVFEIAFMRNLFGLAFMMPWLMRVGLAALHTGHLWRHALRGALSSLNMWCLFAALSLSPVADVSAITFLMPITGSVPDPAAIADTVRRESVERSLEYMGLAAGMPLSEVPVDTVFIGSCTNGRIEDLRAAAVVAKGRKVAEGVQALIVPGSGLVKAQAEEEGLDTIFLEAGFEWREAGCSMCLAMNADKLKPGERSASTSNRNFEGRQGPGGRTHLVSPAMAAAAAVTGHLADVRDLADVE